MSPKANQPGADTTSSTIPATATTPQNPIQSNQELHHHHNNNSPCQAHSLSKDSLSQMKRDDRITALYHADRLFEAYEELMGLNGATQELSSSSASPSPAVSHPLYSKIKELYNFSFPLLHILENPPLYRYGNLCYDHNEIQVRYYDGTGEKDCHEQNPHAQEPHLNTIVPDPQIKTFYKAQNDSHMQSMWIKGIIHSEIIYVIAVLYEVDLYPLWVPRMQHSHLIQELSPFHFYCQFHWNLFWPMADRYLWTEGIGIDRLNRNGEVLIAIRELTEDQEDMKRIKEQSRKELYPNGSSESLVELQCPYAAFVIRSLGEERVELRMVSTVDPNVKYMPSWLQTMATKSASPMVISKIREIVTKVSQGDEKYKEYITRIRETKKDIYDDIQRRINEYWSRKEDEGGQDENK